MNLRCIQPLIYVTVKISEGEEKANFQVKAQYASWQTGLIIFGILKMAEEPSDPPGVDSRHRTLELPPFSLKLPLLL